MPDPRPCDSVQGVEFWIESPLGGRLRCVITEAALQTHFGATEQELSWLSAFMTHRRDIEQLARQALARREDVHVVLVNDSDGRLRASVGRCSA